MFVRSHESRDAETRFGWWWRFVPSVGTILLCIALLLCSPTPCDAQSSEDYVIELGDVIAVPGQLEVLVPVFITSTDDLFSWQMGLDYDDLLIHLIGIEFGGTESEDLSPTVQWDSGSPPYSSLAVIYPIATPFPAGVHRLAAFLRFQVIDPSLIPPGGGLVTGVGIIGTEPHPVLFTRTVGTTTVPIGIDGTITLLSAPLLQVGELQTSFQDPNVLDDGIVQIPVQLWTDGPSTVLAMGLDYDDLLLCSFSLDGGVIEAAVGTNVSLTVTDVGTHTVIQIEATGGAVFPSFSGGVIGHIEMLLGSEPFQGEFPITLVPADCTLDFTPIDNLIDGNLLLSDFFVRGDVDFDGAIQINDAQLILGLVVQGTAVPCNDSADTNDDGHLDISDPIFLLQYLFQSGSPLPPSPFPDAGIDPTGDAIDCL